MKNPEVLASIILSDDMDRAEKLALYKNICYFTDSDNNPLKLTINGKKYNLVIVFPSRSDSFMTIKLLATEDVTSMIDGLDYVVYRVHKTISYEKLVKILKSLPNHANLILKEEN